MKIGSILLKYNSNIHQKGFTLIELIVVMVLIGLLASMAVPRYIDLSNSAGQKALNAGIAELNGRENMTWAKIKTTGSGWIDDETVFSKIDTYLGSDYHWSPGAFIDRGKLHCKDQMVDLRRIPSSSLSPGRWVPQD